MRLIILFLLPFFVLNAAERSIGVRSVTQHPLVQIDPYAKRIASYTQQGNYTFITLNDGTIWKQQTPNILRQAWLIGDEVRLSGNRSTGWLMQNASYEGSAPVQFEGVTGHEQPQLSQSTQAGGEVWLTDNSHWKIDWWERVWSGAWNWSPGDRLGIYQLSDKPEGRTHLLINLDKDLQSAEATLLGK